MAPSISQTEWNRHKRLVLSMRRSGASLLGENGIIARMGMEHGFRATRAQYERQFDDWGDRKNLSASDWRSIFRYLDQNGLCFERNEESRTCEILRNGMRVKPSVLRRKRKDYCTSGYDTRSDGARVLHTSLPECVVIKTSGPGYGDSNGRDRDRLENASESLTCDRTVRADTPSLAAGLSAFNTVTTLEANDPYASNALQLPSQVLQSGRVTTQASSASVKEDLTPEVPLPRFLESSSLTSFPFGIDESVLPIYPPHFTNEASIWFEGTRPFHSPPYDDNISIPNVLPLNGDILADDTIPSLELTTHASTTVDLGLRESLSSYSPLPYPGEASPHRGMIRFLSTPAAQMLRLPLDVSPITIVNSKLIPRTWVAEDRSFQGEPDWLIQQSILDCFPALTAFNSTKYLGNSPGHGLLSSSQSSTIQNAASSSSNTILGIESLRPCLSPLFLSSRVFSSSSWGERYTALHNAFGSTTHDLVILSIENNFAGLDGVPIALSLKLLNHDPHLHYRLLQYHRATPERFSKTLAENLTRAAIEACNATAVLEYLSTGLVNPDKIVCTIDGRRYTALERAAMLRSYEVTEALINASANVNLTYATDLHMERGPLELSVKTWDKFAPINLQLIDLLLDHGTEVRPGPLVNAIHRRDSSLIRKLLFKTSSPDGRSKALLGTILRGAVKFLDNDLATLIFAQFFQRYLKFNHDKCRDSDPRALQELLTAASLKGASQIISRLVDYVPITGEQLAAAIRGGQTSLVKSFLAKGVNVDSPAYCIERLLSGTSLAKRTPLDDCMTTPLAEAIRVSDNQLINEFERRGALSKIDEEGRFGAAICAASEIGNVSYVERLLKMVSGVRGKVLTPALNNAIIECHDEVAMILLRAGADVNNNARSSSHPSPLLEALRRRSKLLVHAIMESDIAICPSLVPAIEWGDRSIIGDLLSLRDRPFTVSEIRAAMTAKDRDLVTFMVTEEDTVFKAPHHSDGLLLKLAIQGKDMAMLEQLLQLGVDPACSLAFRTAALSDRKMLVVLLHAFRAKYPKGKRGCGAAALQTALETADFELLDQLLNAKLDANAFCRLDNDSNVENTLGAAISRYGRLNLAIIRKILSTGANPNGIASKTYYRSSDAVWPRSTPLLLAIRTKSKSLVELLIEAGADIHHAARLGVKRTPLQCACEVGSTVLVDFLINKGADVNEPPAVRGGGTSLQLCAIGGYTGIAYVLLQKGADVHAVPSKNNGRTALEGAAEHGRLDMVKLIWDASISKGLSEEECGRAMKLADENGHTACRETIWECRLLSRGVMVPEISEA